MRLHNRQIKASFFNDPDVAEWGRDKRLYYLGLIQLADDSGCLENRASAFKANIFPYESDADITSSTLSVWVEEFIAEGKAISYEARGKQCLFLVNFHKHQKLDNPAPPDVPLPGWLTWETYPSNKSAGKYVLNTDLLSVSLVLPYKSPSNPLEVLRNPFQPEPEPEPEFNHEPEPEENNTICADALSLVCNSSEDPKPSSNAHSLTLLSDSQKLFLSKFGRKRFATADQAKAIAEIEADVGFEILARALTWAAENNIRSVSSIRTAAKKIAKGNNARSGPSPPNGNSSHVTVLAREVTSGVAQRDSSESDDYYGTSTKIVLNPG
ncbi:MAG: hypothetical protein M1343_08180 [Chloroflexi bacterium]|nr:hypothetical protein [Chloroflexota bacterium]